MISESTGISLNIAVLPVTKKKAKNKITSNAFTRPAGEGSTGPQLPTVSKPVPAKSAIPIATNPIGILKKPKEAGGSSIWKKFKSANKGEGVLEPSFVKPVTKPERLVKKRVKVKDSAGNIPSLDVSYEWAKNKYKKSEDINVEKPIFQNTQKNSFKFLDSGDPSDYQTEVEKPMRRKSIRFSEENPALISDTVTDSKVGFESLKKPKSKIRFSEDKPALNLEEPKGGHGSGRTTSLFGNNPEIPSIPHRAVKPIKEAVFSSSNFEDLELHPYMVKYLKESMGLTKMTTVQEKSIPILLKKQDALIKSQTGSGKTLAFALPILHNLQEIRPKISRADGVLALIVVPTRELALQVYEVFNKLVKSYTWIVPGYLVGGEKRKSEKARLRKGISVLIGTPGRLIDHVQHTKALNLEKVSYLVIDEADRLLDMGYEKDVSVLLDALNQDESKLLKPNYLSPGEEPKEKKEPKERQTILLSATLTAKVEKLAGLSLRNPVFVDACDESVNSTGHVPVFSSDVGNETDAMVLPESLVQKYVVTPPKLKLVTLASFILQKSKLTKKMLIFNATQDMVDYYTHLLSSIFSPSNEEDSDSDAEESSSPFSNSGIELFKLHGNMKQTERTEVFKTFRQSHLGVLLCTDVASRGLDLPEVDWVIQYTGPTSVSDYVHRVGRTARGGQSGSSIIILTPNEISFIGKLENCQIRLQEEKMESCLKHLAMTSGPRGRSVQEEATSLQLIFENMVTQKKELYDLGCKAFASWSRFYASYPRNMRDAFSVKGIHQGHYAKSFALRDTPSVIVNYARKKNLNEERFPRKRLRERKDAEEKPKGGLRGKSRLAEISEFDSGLEPLPKKKKK